MYEVYNSEFHVFSFPILSEGREEDLINVLIDDSQGKSHPRKTTNDHIPCSMLSHLILYCQCSLH